MKKRNIIGLIIFLTFILIALVAFSLCMERGIRTDTLRDDTTSSTSTTRESTTKPTTEPTLPNLTVPTPPPVIKEATATIGATGDILLHDRVIASGYDSTTKTYDYNDIFRVFNQYVSRVDYAVANLEVTLCGNNNGHDYGGYPCFNSPDAIVDALKNAGFDMLLSANNHVYDTGHTGFIRTQQVIDQFGLDRIGTRLSVEDKPYAVVDVNGIKIGMINYTYNTSQSANGTVATNGIPLSNADSLLLNSFNYNQLDSFYEKLKGQLEAMRADGAEATVIYIHWGDEYRTSPNKTQTKIAQALCDMGFDVIVGNHAHVPQPVELLTSQTDGTRKTLCLYSTGNSISNIYRGSFPINTEHGMLFNFTFAKYSAGTVVLESTEVIPTWVYRYDDANWKRKFLVLVMDDAVEDWKAAMNLTDKQLAECQASYERTMGIVGQGVEDANSWFAENQAAIEQKLGID
jgi:poly-gamma-glutamate synthesis protein (capsule biosynthesis protein)